MYGTRYTAVARRILNSTFGVVSDVSAVSAVAGARVVAHDDIAGSR